MDDKDAGTLPSSEFSFGFLNHQFSDCLTRLVPQGKDEAEEDKRECEGTLEIPACSLILAARSEYFRELFGGNFQEGGSKKEGTVELDISDFDTFKDVLFFVYSGSFPAERDKGTLSTLQALRIADRFSCKECVLHCRDLILKQADSFNFEDSLAVLTSPEALVMKTPLEKALLPAKKVVIKEVGQMLGECPSEVFLALPEPVLVTVLNSDLLDVKSESRLLQSALAWVDYNFKSRDAQLASLKQTVLPRIRFQFVPPGEVINLLEDLGKRIQEAGVDAGRQSAVQTLVRFTKENYGDYCLEKEAVVAATSTAIASQCFGLLSLGTASGKCSLRPKALERCARIGYSPPCTTITLEIALSEAESWTSDSIKYSLEHSIGGRWASICTRWSKERTFLDLYFGVCTDEDDVPAALDDIRYSCWRQAADGELVRLVKSSPLDCSASDWKWEKSASLRWGSLVQDKKRNFPRGVMVLLAQVTLI